MTALPVLMRTNLTYLSVLSSQVGAIRSTTRSSSGLWRGTSASLIRYRDIHS